MTIDKDEFLAKIDPDHLAPRQKAARNRRLLVLNATPQGQNPADTEAGMEFVRWLRANPREVREATRAPKTT